MASSSWHREHSIKQGGWARPYTLSKYGCSEISSGSQLVRKMDSRMSVSSLYVRVYISGRGILLTLQLAHQTMTWRFFNSLSGINQSVQPCQRSPAANCQICRTSLVPEWGSCWVGFLCSHCWLKTSYAESHKEKGVDEPAHMNRLTWSSVLVWQWRTLLWKEHCHSLAYSTLTWHYGIEMHSTIYATGQNPQMSK